MARPPADIANASSGQGSTPELGPDVDQARPKGNRGHKPRERTCLASGEVRDPARMIRFVRSPDAQVLPDVMGKLPGRGAYVSPSEDALRTATKRGGFKRGFKTNVTVDADALVDLTRAQLRRALLGRLTMARKGGRLVFGATRVREAAARGDIAIRIEARDGAADGRSKIRTLATATSKELELPAPFVIGVLSAEEIGAALGREPVVHAGILRGPMRAQIAELAVKLSGFEPLVPPEWDDRDHERVTVNRG